MLVGSLAGVVIFGLGLGFSLANEENLTYLLTTLLISGVCLLVLAALGGMLAAVIRDSQDSGMAYGSRHDRDDGGRRSRRGYREPPGRY